MTKTLDSFSTLLELLTNAFLLEEGLQQPSQEHLVKAVANHQSSFTSLKKNLKEAQSEWIPARKGQGSGEGSLGRAYEDAVDSMNRLAQHLNGLRGGTRLQYELTKAGVVGQAKKASDANGKRRVDGVSTVTEETDEESMMLRAAAEMFGDLMDDLGGPLRALSVSGMRNSLETWCYNVNTGYMHVVSVAYARIFCAIPAARKAGGAPVARVPGTRGRHRARVDSLREHFQSRSVAAISQERSV
jgi:hypothetical protein